jgi:acyl-coenzyme A thioesterase PaaI-like protein
VIRPGRRLITVQSEVWAITGDRRKQVAVLLGTMVPVPLAPPS